MCLRGHGQGGYLGLELKSTTLKPDDAEGVTQTGTVTNVEYKHKLSMLQSMCGREN